MDHSLAQAREGDFLEVVAFGRAGAAALRDLHLAL